MLFLCPFVFRLLSPIWYCIGPNVSITVFLFSLYGLLPPFFLPTRNSFEHSLMTLLHLMWFGFTCLYFGLIVFIVVDILLPPSSVSCVFVSNILFLQDYFSLLLTLTFLLIRRIILLPLKFWYLWILLDSYRSLSFHASLFLVNLYCWGSVYLIVWF